MNRLSASRLVECIFDRNRFTYIMSHRKRAVHPASQAKFNEASLANQPMLIVMSSIEIFLYLFFHRTHNSLSSEHFTCTRREKERKRAREWDREQVKVFVLANGMWTRLRCYAKGGEDGINRNDNFIKLQTLLFYPGSVHQSIFTIEWLSDFPFLKLQEFAFRICSRLSTGGNVINSMDIFIDEF